MTPSSTNLRGEGRHGGSRPQLTGEAVQCLPSLCARPGSDRQPECSIIEFGRGRPPARLNKAAGAADATRGGQGSGQASAGVFCGSQGGPCDPTTQNDAGGTPAS